MRKLIAGLLLSIITINGLLASDDAADIKAATELSLLESRSTDEDLARAIALSLADVSIPLREFGFPADAPWITEHMDHLLAQNLAGKPDPASPLKERSYYYLSCPYEGVENFFTPNKMGQSVHMRSAPIEDFTRAASCQYPFLEIGCGSGFHTKETRTGGLTICNDLDMMHLASVIHHTKLEHRGNLRLNNARFPNETRFPSNSIGRCLMAHVGHYLTGAELDEGFAKIFDWLKPGGEFMYTVLTTCSGGPFAKLHGLRELKRGTERWPGEVANYYDYEPTAVGGYPAFVHPQGIEEVSVALRDAGFVITSIRYSTLRGEIGDHCVIARCRKL